MVHHPAAYLLLFLQAMRRVTGLRPWLTATKLVAASCVSKDWLLILITLSPARRRSYGVVVQWHPTKAARSSWIRTTSSTAGLLGP